MMHLVAADYATGNTHALQGHPLDWCVKGLLGMHPSGMSVDEYLATLAPPRQQVARQQMARQQVARQQVARQQGSR